MHCHRNLCRPALALWIVAVAAADARPFRETVSFSVTSNTPFGRSVYVVGNHPDLGSWNPVEAHRLTWSPGDVWTGTVGIEAGVAYAYKFLSRDDAAASSCDGANAHWMSGPDLTGQVPAPPPPPYGGKTLYYLTSWSNAVLVYREAAGSTNFLASALIPVGPGRAPGESLFRIDGVGEPGVPLEFVFTDGEGAWDNAPYPGYGDNNYYASPDVLWVQDGHVYSYEPSPVPDGPVISNHVVASSVPGIPGRTVRVYLPRGYGQHTDRIYPVAVLHDGQNVFAPGGTFGSWDADLTATREISQGRMRETVLVAVDNAANRYGEYCPPGDSVSSVPGVGDAYAAYLLEDVLPFVEARYRVTTNPAHRVMIGSSLGGLVSAYIGLEVGGFGAVGCLSPSFWTAPAFRGRIASNVMSGVRVYLDGGTEEGSSLWDYLWPIRAEFTVDGYVENRDLLTVIGCGEKHDEAAWRNRLPGAFRFLLNPWDEAHALTLDEHPPTLDAGLSGGDVRLSWSRPGRSEAMVDRGDPVAGAWTEVLRLPATAGPWEVADTPVSAPDPESVYRIRVVSDRP